MQADFLRNLLFTVKTHKPRGKVVTRNVHGSGNNPFRPLMRLIVSIIKQKTKHFEHLIRDSCHLSSILANTCLGGGANQRLFKADIKDFFMSGKHGRLLELLSSAPEPRIRTEFVDGVDFLLGSQFLKLPEFPNSVFQVVVGSGMGLLSSDEISSYCFYKLVEQVVLTDSYKQRFGLKLWVRFKDDIFFILDAERETRLLFCQEIKRLSECFIIKFENVSKTSVDMLDMVVFKGKRLAANGKLDTGAFVKVTHQGTSLSSRSGHHPNVHLAWPSSRMQHFSRICSSRVETRAAQVSFWNKLAADCPQHPMLDVLFDRSRGHSSTQAISGPASWLVLPYHPCWGQAKIARAIKAVAFLFRGFDDYSRCIPRVSWCNGGKHLWRCV